MRPVRAAGRARVELGVERVAPARMACLMAAVARVGWAASCVAVAVACSASRVSSITSQIRPQRSASSADNLSPVRASPSARAMPTR